MPYLAQLFQHRQVHTLCHMQTLPPLRSQTSGHEQPTSRTCISISSAVIREHTRNLPAAQPILHSQYILVRVTRYERYRGFRTGEWWWRYRKSRKLHSCVSRAFVWKSVHGCKSRCVSGYYGFVDFLCTRERAFCTLRVVLLHLYFVFDAICEI